MLDHERSCLTCGTLRPETPATAGGFVRFHEWTGDLPFPTRQLRASSARVWLALAMIHVATMGAAWQGEVLSCEL